jgi:hypothetical protein
MSGETGQEDSSRGGNSGLGTRNRRLFLASAASAVAASTLPLPAAAAGNSVAEVLDVLGYNSRPVLSKPPFLLSMALTRRVPASIVVSIA